MESRFSGVGILRHGTSEPPIDPPIKIILLGDTCVGKSSLLIKYLDNIFMEHGQTTIGVDYRSIYLRGYHLQIWDTAGQERYRAILPNYYRHVNAVILCFDLTRRETFLHLNQWLETIAQIQPTPIVILVGNKTDLTDFRVVSPNDLQSLIDRIGTSMKKFHCLKYVETSAKEDQPNVLQSKILEYIITTYENNLREHSLTRRGSDNISRTSSPRRRCCYD